jgi:hypothetical protein
MQQTGDAGRDQTGEHAAQQAQRESVLMRPKVREQPPSRRYGDDRARRRGVAREPERARVWAKKGLRRS